MCIHPDRFRFGSFLLVIGMTAFSHCATAQMQKKDYATQEKKIADLTVTSNLSIGVPKPKLTATTNLKGYTYKKDSLHVQPPLVVSSMGNRMATKQDSVLLLAHIIKSWHKE